MFTLSEGIPRRSLRISKSRQAIQSGFHTLGSFDERVSEQAIIYSESEILSAAQRNIQDMPFDESPDRHCYRKDSKRCGLIS